MKALSNFCTVVLLLNITSLCRAQQAATIPPPTPYTVISRGANSRVWERTTYERSPSGQIIPHKHHYTELATGLCYQQDGKWADSQELINILPDGTAAATRGQHQVYFPGDIAQGVIKLVTPDGEELYSRPVGLSFDDGSNTVLFAVLTNSLGELAASNQVIYPDAFEGAAASLRYTYTKAGFEQDVLVQKQLPDPASYGLDPNATHLQVLTEFFDTSDPVQKGRSTHPHNGLADTTLTFGTMKMPQGRAFSINQTKENSRKNGIPTYKSWVQLDGRKFLLEEVPYERIAPQLKSLPTVATAHATVKGILNKVSAKRLLPPNRLAQTSTNVMQLAGADINLRPGVVLDYIELGDSGDCTLSNANTYYVSGPVECDNLTIEGGVIVKYPLASYATAYISVSNVCSQTAPYRPAIFTAVDDESVGEYVEDGGSTGTIQSGGYASPVLSFNTGAGTLENIRFCFAQEAIYLFDTDLLIRDCQFVSCDQSINNDGDGGPGQVTIENCLIGDPTRYFNSLGDTAFTISLGCNINLYNCTVDFMDHLISGTGTMYAVNSIFSDIGGEYSTTNLSGAYNGFWNDINTFGDYQFSGGSYTVGGWASGYSGWGNGGGNYYLGNNDFRGVGTSDTNYIYDLSVLSDIAQKTTHPPISDCYTFFSTNETLGPVTSGDTQSNPDLGYHYDRLDYVVYGSIVDSNLTVLPGTVIGWLNGSDSSGTNPVTGSLTTLYGGIALQLQNGASVNFKGTATDPCYVVRCNTVWEEDMGGDTIVFSTGTNYSTTGVNANFAHFDGFGDTAASTSDNGPIYFDASSLAVNATNSEFWNGQFGGNGDATSFSWNLFNCLLNNTWMEFDSVSRRQQSYSISLQNCTLLQGTTEFIVGTSNNCSLYAWDNAFDETGTWLVSTNIHGNDSVSISRDYNAMDVTAYSPTNIHDIFVTNFNWQPSWFGNFYLPSDSPLIQKGSTNANLLGLYHFTTQTNQIPDGTNTVTIGYHYVATDQYGNPLDSNADGIPDYLEDANGDGVFDAGDLRDWQNTLYLNVIIAQPHNGSTIH